MMAVAARLPERAWVALALGAGLAALGARRVDAWAVVATAGVGVAGLMVPVPQVRRAGLAVCAATLVAGAAVFAAVRWGWAMPQIPFTAWAAGASVIAAVAQEAFFRRALYGRLEVLGPATAVVVTAVAFALVHVPVYGWGVLPVDVAAGLVFGWQRWASGTWTVPAVTHAFANLIQMG